MKFRPLAVNLQFEYTLLELVNGELVQHLATYPPPPLSLEV